MYSAVEVISSGVISSNCMKRIVVPRQKPLVKLKYEHLHLTSFSKMRVDLAAQVSHSVIMYIHALHCVLYVHGSCMYMYMYLHQCPQALSAECPPHASYTSLPLMYQLKWLMWSQTPPDHAHPLCLNLSLGRTLLRVHIHLHDIIV